MVDDALRLLSSLFAVSTPSLLPVKPCGLSFCQLYATNSGVMPSFENSSAFLPFLSRFSFTHLSFCCWSPNVVFSHTCGNSIQLFNYQCYLFPTFVATSFCGILFQISKTAFYHLWCMTLAQLASHSLLLFLGPHDQLPPHSTCWNLCFPTTVTSFSHNISF